MRIQQPRAASNPVANMEFAEDIGMVNPEAKAGNGFSDRFLTNDSIVQIIQLRVGKCDERLRST